MVSMKDDKTFRFEYEYTIIDNTFARQISALSKVSMIASNGDVMLIAEPDKDKPDHLCVQTINDYDPQFDISNISTNEELETCLLDYMLMVMYDYYIHAKADCGLFDDPETFMSLKCEACGTHFPTDRTYKGIECPDCGEYDRNNLKDTTNEIKRPKFPPSYIPRK